MALRDIPVELSIPWHVTTAPEKLTDTGPVKNSPSTDNPAVNSLACEVPSVIEKVRADNPPANMENWILVSPS